MHHRSQLISSGKHSWAHRSIGKVTRTLNGAPRPATRSRRCLLIHLDGVPKAVLDGAMAKGRMPFLSRLLASGAYGYDTAFWGSPASTPSFQASMLYGIRHPNLPAYHWYDRILRRQVRMNIPKDTLEIDGRLNEKSRSMLLEGGGTAYLSLFRAGASNLLCMSALGNKTEVLRNLPDCLRGIRGPAKGSVGGFLSRTGQDLFDSALDVTRWVEQVNDWRFEREFLFSRFFLASLGWSLSCARAIIDMVKGVPAIYLVYGGYDEVSHRRGPFSAQAKRDLFRVDGVLEELFAIAHSVEHPYDVYLLTDHGHVDSAPFERRRGRTLQQYLSLGKDVPLPADIERGLLDGRLLPRGIRMPVQDEPLVVDAGNFAHVYLERGNRPLEALDVLRTHRHVLARAVSEPDIGIVVVRRGDQAVAVTRGGVYSADEVGSAPLPPQVSKGALKDLLRELPVMSNAGDLVLYGTVLSDDATVGFAWEFGSHGGLTKNETESLVLWPLDAPIDLSSLGHAIQLHEKLSEVYRN